MKKETLDEEVKDKNGNPTTIVNKIKKHDAVGGLEQTFRSGDLGKWHLLTDIAHVEQVKAFVDEEIPRLFKMLDKRPGRNKFFTLSSHVRGRVREKEEKKQWTNWHNN